MNYRLIFFIVVIVSCTPKKKNVSELIEQRVKSVVESIHDPMGTRDSFEHNPMVSEHTLITKLLFNEKGLLLQESKFNSKGNLEWKTAFRYDAHDNPIQQDVFKPNGTLSDKITSRYDSADNLIEGIEVDAGGKVICKQTSHIREGNRIITTYRSFRGRFIKILECVFDKRNLNVLNNHFTNELLEKEDPDAYSPLGNQIRVSYTLVSAGSIQKVASFYEDNGEVANYRNDETLRSSDQHVYDADGNRTETIQYFPPGKQIITRYTYAKNSMEVATLTGNWMIASKRILRYDDNGNLIEALRYGLGGLQEEHEKHLYQYDPVGNWIKHKTIINDRSVAVALRQIEYF